MKTVRRYSVLAALLFSIPCFSQEVPKGFELTEVVKIAETYRQVPNLSFDILFTYADSAQQNSILEQLQGSQKIHNGKYWSLLDSIELLQGNQYSLGIYHKDSLVIINSKQDYSSVLQLPMMDSLFRASNIAGMDVTRLNDSTRSLKVQFNEGAAYRGYEIQYDLNTFLIRKVKYFVPDAGDEDNPPVGSGVVCISITFSNYSDELIGEQYFDESKFIYRQADQFITQPAFSGYRVITSLQGQNN